MTDPTTHAQAEPPSRDTSSVYDGGGQSGLVAPGQLIDWLQSQCPVLAIRWFADIERRNGRWSDEVCELMRWFLGGLVTLMPGCLGPYRSQVEPLWHQAAELFGSLGAMRGLAAGEIIEEFQLLREVVLRRLYADPPGGDVARLGLRDTLRLNRVIDAGVTHASVGHTDALFFALFQGSGVPESLTGELVDEVREQLTALRKEHDALLRLSRD